MTWSYRIFLVGVIDWTSNFPISASETGSFTVPDGAAGDVLTIVAGCNGPGGRGDVVYKYVSGATQPPPERIPAPEPAIVPEMPTPTVPPPSATPAATETPPPATELPTQQDTPAPAPSEPQPSYGPVTFSSDYDYGSMQPLEPGYEFAAGITTLYANWSYSGVTAGTLYEYEWYRNGQLIESSGNALINEAGQTYDIYVRDPGAQQPLDPGNYVYRVKINGQPILSAECVVY
jgi:hypothetical protein